MTTAPANNANKAPEDRILGTLPVWDLTDLYPGNDSPELNADLDRVAKDAAAFSGSYKGKLSGLSGKALGAAIAEYEAIDEIMGRIMSYAQLVYAGNVSDPDVGRFYQTMQERVNDISAHVLFFALELNEIDDKVLAKQLKAAESGRYKPWVDDARLFRPHQLDEEIERLLHDKRVAGRSAWNRLFDETMADMRFDHEGGKITSEEVMNMLSNPDEGVRKKASETLGQELQKHARTFSLITNTLAKDKEIEDKWRHFARPDRARG